MKINFPSVLNILQSLAEKFSLPAVNQNVGAYSDAQADAVDEHTDDKELESLEVDYDFESPRWIYRSHYRSIFPPLLKSPRQPKESIK